MPADPVKPGFPRRHKGATRIAGRDFVVHGLPAYPWRDAYHKTLTMRWPWFFSSAAALFLVFNAIYACIYLMGRDPIANLAPSGFLGAFYFSVETLATVGYGDMHPQTVFAHSVATVEIFTGMSMIALLTGMVFARFSLPKAKIIFARYPVIGPVEGALTLMIRAANARQNVIAEATARLRLMQLETTVEGLQLRRVHDLKLIREQHPVFALGWNLMHVIDESSPLYGASPQSLAALEATLLLGIEGYDETTAQTMRARAIWTHDTVRWNHRYTDLTHKDQDGVTHIDYTKFDDVQPL